MGNRTWKVHFQKSYFECACCGAQVGLFYGSYHGIPLVFDACHGDRTGDPCDFMHGGSYSRKTLELIDNKECSRCEKKELPAYKKYSNDLFAGTRKIFDFIMGKHGYTYCHGHNMLLLLRWHVAMKDTVYIYESLSVIDPDVGLRWGLPRFEEYPSKYVIFVTHDPSIASNLEKHPDAWRDVLVKKMGDKIVV